MSNFGHVHTVQAVIDGRTITFRSKLEYRWAIWCQLRKEQGMIKNWWYENEKIEITTKTGDKKYYRPDFTIETEDGYEFEETKGFFTAKDYTRMKLTAEQYENSLTLIFAKRPYGIQYRRAEKLQKPLKRIIYDANKSIFKPIKHLFDF